MGGNAATAAGVNLSGYARKVYMFPRNACAWAGLGNVGGGVVKPLNERLRLEFTSQNSHVQFLDVFAPVAVRQIISALEGPDQLLQYVADFLVAEDGPDYVLTATILQPCAVRIEVHQTLEAPLPRVKVVEQSAAAPGPFERRIDARYRIHGHMLLMMLNDDECCLHRMQARHQTWQ